MKKHDENKEKPKNSLTEEQQLINEFGKHEGSQPIPQPKDYDEIEY